MKFRAIDFDYHNDAMQRIEEDRVDLAFLCVLPTAVTRPSPRKKVEPKVPAFLKDDDFRITNGAKRTSDESKAKTTQKDKDVAENTSPASGLDVENLPGSKVDVFNENVSRNDFLQGVKLSFVESPSKGHVASTKPDDASNRRLNSSGHVSQHDKLEIDATSSWQDKSLFHKIVMELNRSMHTKRLASDTWSNILLQHDSEKEKVTLPAIINSPFHIISSNKSIDKESHDDEYSVKVNDYDALQPRMAADPALTVNDTDTIQGKTLPTVLNEDTPTKSESSIDDMREKWFGDINASPSVTRYSGTLANRNILNKSSGIRSDDQSDHTSTKQNSLQSIFAHNSQLGLPATPDATQDDPFQQHLDENMNKDGKSRSGSDSQTESNAANRLIQQICSDLKGEVELKKRKRSNNSLFMNLSKRPKRTTATKASIAETSELSGDKNEDSAKLLVNKKGKSLGQSLNLLERKRSAENDTTNFKRVGQKPRSNKSKVIPTSATLRGLLRVAKGAHEKTDADMEKNTLDRSRSSHNNIPEYDSKPSTPKSNNIALKSDDGIPPLGNKSNRTASIFDSISHRDVLEDQHAYKSEHAGIDDKKNVNVVTEIKKYDDESLSVRDSQDIAHFDRYTSKQNTSPSIGNDDFDYFPNTFEDDYDDGLGQLDLSSQSEKPGSVEPNKSDNSDCTCVSEKEVKTTQIVKTAKNTNIYDELAAFGIIDDDYFDEQIVERVNDSRVDTSVELSASLAPEQIELLCSDGFATEWSTVVDQLASGDWDGQNDSTSPVRSIRKAHPKIELIQTSLVDASGVDIELPYRDGILVIPTSALESDATAKARVIDLAQKAAMGRYKHIQVILTYETFPTPPVTKRIVQLQTSAIYSDSVMNTTFAFKLIPAAKTAFAIAETVLMTVLPLRDNDNGSNPTLCSHVVKNNSILERARFLLQIMPLLTASGALAMIELGNKVAPQQQNYLNHGDQKSPFALLFQSQRHRQQMSLAITSTPSKAPEVHAGALLQLNKVLHVSLSRTYK